MERGKRTLKEVRLYDTAAAASSLLFLALHEVDMRQEHGETGQILNLFRLAERNTEALMIYAQGF